MLKLVTVALLLVAAVAANPTETVFRHRYQRNAVRLLGVEPSRGGRIVGGADARIEDHPYQIALFYTRRHTCGGSILNQYTILSAAHCTFDRDLTDFQVLAGESNINDGTLNPAWTVIEHPEYDDDELTNDIVILKITDALVFSTRIQPISLPTPNFQVAPGSATTLAGWGTLEWNTRLYPDVLQAVVKPSLSNEECQRIYTDEEILDTHLCSGEYGRDACQGDSGGPLVYNNVHVGIVSWGYYCARDYPTVYTRVSSFLTFILSHA